MNTPSDLHQRFSFVAALGLLAAMSATAVDIVLPATPTLEKAFSIGAEEAQLVITAYVAGMALGLVPVGVLADRFGRRPVILVCVSLFILAGAATLAPLTFPMLLALRFIQGLSGAVGPSLSRAIVRDLDAPNGGAQLMAVMTAILSMAPLVGPVLGGVLAALLGWRAPFWSSAIYGLMTIIAILFWLPETRRHESKRSMLGQVADALTAISRSPRSQTGIMLFTLPFVGYFAMITSLSAVMHDLHGVPAARFGVLFALSAITYFLGAMLTRRLLNKVTADRVLPIGIAVLGGTGLFMISLIFWHHPPALAFWLSGSAYMLGMAICLPITTMEALGPLARSAGFGASILGTSQIGIGALGSLTSAYFYDGTQRSMCSVAAVASLVAVLIFLMRRHTLFSQGR